MRLCGQRVYETRISSRNRLLTLASVGLGLLFRSFADEDVSTVRFLSGKWAPGLRDAAPPRKKEHRAMEDIKESIAELKYYKDSLWRV